MPAEVSRKWHDQKYFPILNVPYTRDEMIEYALMQEALAYLKSGSLQEGVSPAIRFFSFPAQSVFMWVSDDEEVRVQRIK